jgi:hypothetical protein
MILLLKNIKILLNCMIYLQSNKMRTNEFMIIDDSNSVLY